MFNPQELAQLIGGEETIIDLDDLRAHSVVSGFTNDDTIKFFWKVSRVFLKMPVFPAEAGSGGQKLRSRAKKGIIAIRDELFSSTFTWLSESHPEFWYPMCRL